VQNNQSFLEILEDYVESDKVTLPPFDRTALMIQQEIQKPDVKISKIESLIITDLAMSSQILKIANSAFFKGLSKVITIREAIVRLGLDEIIRIIIILTQKDLYGTKDTFIKNYRSKLWQHALVCAQTSQWVAKEAGFEEITQEIFFASLMHDIGKLFLITVIENIKKSNAVPFIPSKSIINEIIKDHHAEQGYKLMKKWNLPDKYCQAAKDHHDKEFDLKNVSLIILRLVNKTCNKVGISTDKQKSSVDSITAEANFFGFSEIKLAQLELQIEDALKRVNAHYKIKPVSR
jgi:HD-like signal output (HDOD) protein